MKHYLGLPKVFLCCVAMGVLSGCVEIAGEIATGIYDATHETHIRGAWGVKSIEAKDYSPPTWGIERDKTTKSEVLAKLSMPEEKTSDGRFFLYRYEYQNYKIRKKDKIVVERIPVGRPRHARFLIWFTQTDYVRRYRWHDCKPTGDRKCHYLNDMCQMIKGLQEKQLIAQYC